MKNLDSKTSRKHLRDDSFKKSGIAYKDFILKLYNIKDDILGIL